MRFLVRSSGQHPCRPIQRPSANGKHSKQEEAELRLLNTAQNTTTFSQLSTIYHHIPYGFDTCGFAIFPSRMSVWDMSHVYNALLCLFSLFDSCCRPAFGYLLHPSRSHLSFDSVSKQRDILISLSSCPSHAPKPQNSPRLYISAQLFGSKQVLLVQSEVQRGSPPNSWFKV